MFGDPRHALITEERRRSLSSGPRFARGPVSRDLEGMGRIITASWFRAAPARLLTSEGGSVEEKSRAEDIASNCGGAQSRLCRLGAEFQTLKRFDEFLRDFYCTNPDKSLVDRAGFLEQTAVPVTIKNLEAHDVQDSRDGRFRASFMPLPATPSNT